MSDPVVEEHIIDVWFRTVCRTRRNQAILIPPFRWRYLLTRWGWRVYVLGWKTRARERKHNAA